jgi:4'-phosphopantetheinyl transferase EntD
MDNVATPAMLGELLPAQVAAVEQIGDPEPAQLYPEEAARMAGAAAKRRLEFAAVRSCARAALAQLGLPPAAIMPGERGAPGWPAGVVGSMTHCDGYRAAALARATDVASIGIDAERHRPLPDGVGAMVIRDEEAAKIAELAGAEHENEICWDMVLFSAKESVYKAWFPLTRRWLDFGEASITFDPRSRVFTAQLLVPGPELAGRVISAFDGRWLVRDGFVLTAVVAMA